MSAIDFFRRSLKNVKEAIVSAQHAPSSEVLDYITGATLLVEANDFETYLLWKRRADSVAWRSMHGGYGKQVGSIADRPICISIRGAIINKQKVIFWHATSVVVDYDQIANWFKLWLPDAARADANGFHVNW